MKLTAEEVAALKKLHEQCDYYLMDEGPLDEGWQSNELLAQIGVLRDVIARAEQENEDAS